MSFTFDTAVALDTLAQQIEALTAASPAHDQQLYSLIVEPALTIKGQALPPLAPYTSNLITALNRLRPRGFVFATQEIWSPNPPTHVAGFEKKGDKPGYIVGGASGFGVGSTLTLAGCAAIARVWAALVREWLTTSLRVD
jgi:hypothetical protein